MIGTYAFACTIVDATRWISPYYNWQRYSDTHAGEIKQTDVNTTQGGTIPIPLKNFNNCKDQAYHNKLIESKAQGYK